MDVPTNITMLWCRFVFIKSEIEQKAKTDQNWSEELRLCLEAIQQADQLLFNLGGQGELHLGGHWTVTSWELIVNMFGSSCEQFIHLDLEVLLIISPWTCEPCDVFINFKRQYLVEISLTCLINNFALVPTSTSSSVTWLEKKENKL